MPWCEPCAKYLAPSALDREGRCPLCGNEATRTTVSGRVSPGDLDLKRLASVDGETPESAPWHFKLLVFLLVVYLGWRVVDLFV